MDLVSWMPLEMGWHEGTTTCHPARQGGVKSGARRTNSIQDTKRDNKCARRIKKSGTIEKWNSGNVDSG